MRTRMKTIMILQLIFLRRSTLKLMIQMIPIDPENTKDPQPQKELDILRLAIENVNQKRFGLVLILNYYLMVLNYMGLNGIKLRLMLETIVEVFNVKDVGKLLEDNLLSNNERKRNN